MFPMNLLNFIKTVLLNTREELLLVDDGVPY